MKRKYVYINSFGYIYKVTYKKYLKFLKDLSENKNADIKDYGRFILAIDRTVSEMDSEEAIFELEYERGKDETR